MERVESVESVERAERDRDSKFHHPGHLVGGFGWCHPMENIYIRIQTQTAEVSGEKLSFSL